jgi:hypothetical protein
VIYVPEALLDLVAKHAAIHGVPVPVTLAVTREIVTEAAQLANGRIEDEPAALFYACARRAKALASVGRTFYDDVATSQAAAVGLKLDADDLDIMLLRGQVAFGTAGWKAVRAAFTGWLRAPGRASKRAAPKRPR